MRRLRIIRPLTTAEQQHIERLYKECEAPGCTHAPECALTLEREGEPPLLVYACISHAEIWATEGGMAVWGGTDAEEL